MERFDPASVDAFLVASGLSDENRRRCMRVIRRLIAGQGIRNKRKADVFMAGRVVTRATDLETLKALAKAWLPYTGKGPHLDSSNGWSLAHPIQKLIQYRDATQPRAAPPSPLPSGFGAGLVAFYERELQASRGEEAPAAVAARAPPAARFAAPDASVQMARTLGINGHLKQWLRHGAGNTGRNRINYLNACDSVRLDKIRAYLRTTEEGATLLRAARLTCDTATLDHVNPQSKGGSNHIFNLHLMPGAANSHFRERHWMDAEKQLYVGPTQVELVKKLMVSMRPLASEVTTDL